MGIWYSLIHQRYKFIFKIQVLPDIWDAPFLRKSGLEKILFYSCHAGLFVVNFVKAYFFFFTDQAVYSIFYHYSENPCFYPNNQILKAGGSEIPPVRGGRSESEGAIP